MTCSRCLRYYPRPRGPNLLCRPPRAGTFVPIAFDEVGHFHWFKCGGGPGGLEVPLMGVVQQGRAPEGQADLVVGAQYLSSSSRLELVKRSRGAVLSHHVHEAALHRA